MTKITILSICILLFSKGNTNGQELNHSELEDLFCCIPIAVETASHYPDILGAIEPQIDTLSALYFKEMRGDSAEIIVVFHIYNSDSIEINLDSSALDSKAFAEAVLKILATCDYPETNGSEFSSTTRIHLRRKKQKENSATM